MINDNIFQFLTREKEMSACRSFKIQSNLVQKYSTHDQHCNLGSFCTTNKCCRVTPGNISTQLSIAHPKYWEDRAFYLLSPFCFVFFCCVVFLSIMPLTHFVILCFKQAPYWFYCSSMLKWLLSYYCIFLVAQLPLLLWWAISLLCGSHLEAWFTW